MNSRMGREVEDYWRNALEDFDCTPFPAVPPSVQQLLTDRAIDHQIPWPRERSLDITTSNLIRAAWALVAGRLTNTQDVVFGVTVSGRSASVVGIDEVTVPTIATVPLRVKLGSDQRVSQYLDAVQQQATEMMPFEQAGLQQIAKISAGGRQACQFQTLLVIKPQYDISSDNPLGNSCNDNRQSRTNTHALILELELGTESITATARFDSRVIEQWTVQKLLERLGFVLQQLYDAESEQSLAGIEMVTQQDLEEIWDWNGPAPAPVEQCVHEMFEERARAQPNAPAICAWDGELTYGELDQLATRLAGRLVDLDIGPGLLVPLCFEKSMWTSVAMLGVLKAGGGFVLLDSSLPEERLHAMVQQVKAGLLLSSVSNQALSSRLAKEIFTLDSKFFTDKGDSKNHCLPAVSPSSVMYVIFTSGSTGAPKGVVINHRNIASALHYQEEQLGLTTSTRLYDFASYSFDCALYNAFPTLVAGGCLCVPSDEDRRNHLQQSIVSLRANVVILTPSVARFLSPVDVPQLQTLMFGGEALRIKDVNPWWGRVRLLNTYGPAECTSVSTLSCPASSPEDVTRIGKGVGQVTWVVDPENHDYLLPPGCIGELLLEGPLVGPGYLNDPEKTEAAFIKDPAWLLRGTTARTGRHGRLYKTGDLVQYNEDGSLTFIGRKDTQVKIRGQRIELGEVEYRVQECMPEARQVVAEIIVPQGENSRPVLAAFLQMDTDGMDTDIRANILSITAAVTEKLAKHLPSYMVPTAFFSLPRLPRSASAKTDRRKLREIGGSFSAHQLAEMQTAKRGTKRQPTTQLEQDMQRVWGQVLGIQPAIIGVDDDFFQLGGDSITAMKVVREARKIGVELTVADIFRHPTLEHMAYQGLHLSESTPEEIAPFSLLDYSLDIQLLLQDISTEYQLDPTTIKDTYPCTPLQEGLLSLSSKSPGDYIMQATLELSPNLDLTNFRNAWEVVARTMAILRTRIVQQHNAGLLQVVLDEQIHWIEATGLDTYLQVDKQQPIEMGQPLTRYALVKDDTVSHRWFVWTVHHALYDGWSLPIIFNTVNQVYCGNALTAKPQFNIFIKYLREKDDEVVADYWRNALDDYDDTPFPAVLPSVQQISANRALEHQIPLPRKHSKGITTSNLIRAAWALVAGRLTNTKDVVFGVTVSGRSASVVGIDEIAAPTIATVPVRVKLGSDQRVSQYLDAVQQQATEMMPFEQVGLQRIAKISAGGRQACKFQTLLVVQAEEDSSSQDLLGKWYDDSYHEDINTYSLVLAIRLAGDKITAIVRFDSRVIDSWMVRKLLERLEFVMKQLDSAHREETLAGIEMVTQQDLEEIWGWNRTVPQTVDRCVHELIGERALAQPSAPAVCAWDGELTYRELNHLATKLAGQLVGLGVGPAMVVPLCFEKSMWTTVAMLGVLKAGGAFVLLDPSLPVQRLKTIVDQVETSLLVSSLSNQVLSSQLAQNVIILTADLFVGMGNESSPHLQSPNPSSAVYVIFTSGSTGMPKGVVLTHKNIASALYHQAGIRGFTTESRVFNFASYSFDVSINNTFTTLVAGGCLCVPSDEDRKNDLLGSILALRANVVNFTPTVARFLSPEQLPDLQTIIFGGEALSIRDIRPWWGKVRVLNAYGPAECTPNSTINCGASSLEEATCIGKGAGLLTWVVEPENHDRLLPPGCIGELLLEGPLVGPGYLTDSEKSAAAFVEDPSWLLRGTSDWPGRHGRLYKTGDLVQYNVDGNLTYIGRKDAQVKIRGQRVELGEVEHRIQECMLEARMVVAEVILPQGEDSSPMLVAFLQMTNSLMETGELENHPPSILPIAADIKHKLAENLPVYMVPTVFFSMRELPMTATGKTNRRKLREIGGSFSAHQLAEMQTAKRGTKRQPTTKLEQDIQRVWGQVLSIQPAIIGVDDDFFQLGGDSIAAMKVVREARKIGVELTVADIFRHPTLEHIARQGLHSSESTPEEIAPFSLLDYSLDIQLLLQDISTEYQLDPTAIKDTYPCTPLQEGLLSLSSKSPGDYIMQATLELSLNLDLTNFRNAWEVVAQTMAILRTRIVQQYDAGLLQVVLDEQIHWIEATGLDTYLQVDKQQLMGIGQPLTRYAIIKDDTTSHRWFVWTVHHVLYDGWSLPIIFNAVNQVYCGNPLTAKPQFNTFIKYLREKDDEVVADYWRNVLEDYDDTPFPAVLPSVQQILADRALEHQILLPRKHSLGITTSNLIRAAWALVAGRLTNTQDVVFGVTVSGRSASVVGIDEIAAPTIATVPVRVKFAGDLRISEYLQTVQQQATNMIPFEQAGLQRIAKISAGGQQACQFQTLLVVQPQRNTSSNDLLQNWYDGNQQSWINTYALILELELGAGDITAKARFDSRVIEAWTVQKMLELLSFVTWQLDGADHEQLLATIKIITQQDLEEIWNWNQAVPLPVERCVHNIIEEWARTQPSAPAICAWDGKLTYGELDRLATRLAGQLVDLGVGPGVFVPLCFEKSMWAPVSMLAIIKTGGAFVLLEPSLPEQRLHVIVQQVNASLLLSSVSNQALSSRLAQQVVTVSSELFSAQNGQPNGLTYFPDPSSVMYVVFTSGSTGTPKGVMITHRNFASSIQYQSKDYGFSTRSRVFDFSSYAFDMSVGNYFNTLGAGGCVCVPNEQDRRNNLAGSIASLHANVVHLTPSVARLLVPEDVPELQSILCGGEALNFSDVDIWWGKVRLVNVYGPAECTPNSTMNPNPSSPEEATRIGKGIGMATWVVHPDHHDCLLPPGCIGELLLEGPLVGAGYLHEPEKTAAAFIENPEWLLQGTPSHPGRNGRLYKTGDLVRYNADGSLTYLGRKDAQVKIRGQRVELGEVEHRVKECMPYARVVAAEIIVPEGENSSPTLAAFLQMNNASETNEPEGVNAQILSITAEIEEKLAENLPVYMVPAVFFSMQELPMTPTGKTNRKRLREIGGSFSVQQLAEMRTTALGSKRQPTSEVERQMQGIWAQVLGIESTAIGLGDSFFRLGGDSIAAMKVVAEARKVGIKLAVAEIFRHPRLDQMASYGLRLAENALASIPPLALLGDGVDITTLLEDLSDQCQLGLATVQDVYPCTPLQEGLLSLSLKRPGNYMMQGVLELSPDVISGDFRAAWGEVVQKMAILRTRIVQHNQFGLLQVVLVENIHWIEATGLQKYLRDDRKQPMALGQPLTRHALVNDDSGKPKWFVWTVHHALYDGWSLPLIVDAVDRVYHGNMLDCGPQFNAFIKYTREQDDTKMEEYWRNALENCDCAPFPTLPTSVQQPVSDNRVEHRFFQPRNRTLDITTSTLIRAAWALVSGCMSNSKDVVFGVTVSGRNAPVVGIDEMVGPTIATVPVRIRMPSHQKVSEYLEAVQHQALEMISFEQIGLHRIARMGADGQQACMFQTLLVVQPQGNGASQQQLGKWQEGGQQEWFNTYALTLQLRLAKDNISAIASFDSRVIEAWTVQKLLERLEFVIQQLDDAGPEQTLADIKIVTQCELEELWDWNRTVPPPVERCVHGMIKELARAQPTAPAICAWDGELTYGELDQLATRLAGRLVDLGVYPDVLVPICFEKSMWVPVSMLAVLKAGGGFVLLDPSLPEQRLHAIVQQTNATLVLSSPSCQALSLRLAAEVVTVNSGFFTALADQPNRHMHAANPSSAIYVIFTSGSTGTPKGVMTTHRNVASALIHQRNGFGYTTESRVFDFASYSFGAALHNAFATLSAGGCLCIPSNQDRRNNLPGSIASLRANFVLLTPSVADSLPPQEVPGLRTIIFGGEGVFVKNVQPWWDNVRVLTAYGSSECTTVSTINSTASCPAEATRIGHGAGLVPWVVDPKDHTSLLPIGCTGELLLEGPLVTSGYLNDPEKTASAFIEDPEWLLQGTVHRPGRHGRLYKTGDLVRFNEDGSLTYVGRKDTQIKIRGQRIELGEVEHRVQECVPKARQVVAEVIVPQGENSSPTLAAFLLMSKNVSTTDNPEGIQAKILPIAADIEEKLAEYLPIYMIPTVFFSMQELPMTPTGKMNRRRLREIGGSFSLQQLADMGTTRRGTKRSPMSEVERQMQKIWGQVLNIDPATIGLDDSFFRLGGDSITAMQVSSVARSSSINIRVADILQKKTISALTKGVEITSLVQHPPTPSHGRPSDASYQLSPIQRVYVHLQSDPTICFDQYFLLALRRKIDLKSVSRALETIVCRHSILRARFCKTEDGIWEQRITNDVLGSFDLHAETSAGHRTPKIIAQCRERLNIENGPLSAAVFFDNTEPQTLFLTIHHLVVDLVSWRVLFRELEELLTFGTITIPPPLGFQSWSTLQAQYAIENLEPKTSTPFEVQPPLLTYWGMECSTNLQDGIMVKTFDIDKEISSMLLGSCNDTLRTRSVELMISAIIYSFGLVFPDRVTPPIFTEGHGREVWDDRIDISTTVGWFTTLFPVQVSTANNSLIDTIRRTKDCMRSLPQNGWSYFTSRFATEANARKFMSEFPVEVLFNYSGQYQQLERSDGLFEEMSLPDGCDQVSCLELRRLALFDINVRVDRGHLAASVSYHQDTRHQDKILEWVETYEAILIQMAKELPAVSPDWTLSDFPLAFKSYDDIQEFNDIWLSRLGIVQPDDIEDIFPCSPMQEGMLIAQAKDSSNYRSWSCVEICTAEDGARLDLDRLQQAWKAVVKRHTLLRALLVYGFPGTSRIMHVILKDPLPGISCLGPKNKAMLTGPPNNGGPAYQTYGLQHHLTICELDETRAYIRLDIDHSIVDGFSQRMLWDELWAAYNDSLGPTGSYRDFIEHIEEQPQDAGLDFWTRHLAGVQPCLFPTFHGERTDCDSTGLVDVLHIDTDKIHEFCAKWEVTVATIIHVAWALVLSKYTGTNVPCFGNLRSGRDIPIDNVDQIFGPLIAMVPCRIFLDKSESVLGVLKKVQDDYVSSLSHQHFSLAEIHGALRLGSSPLFNSVLSFQRAVDDSQVHDELTIRHLDEYTRTEYDISISAVDSREEVRIHLFFRPGCLTLGEAGRLAGCISTAISEIIISPSRPFQELGLLGDIDLEQIWEWNSTVPAAVERCVHEIIEERVQAQSSAPAVCAWDGELTYGELNKLATQLAGKLVNLGVGSDVLVPLCFEKSMWTTVALLGVLKAGGAFVLLDPSLPEHRLQDIVGQTKASLLLSSSSNYDLSVRLAQKVVTVSSAFFTDLGDLTNRNLHNPSPSSVAYVVFTSGSTGTPKGVIITHRNMASALHYQNDPLRFTAVSRVFDFASYGFDVSINNALMTLAVGGCLCVPSDQDRKNRLAESIAFFHADVVSLTPSVAKFLDPEKISELKTLLFGGEKVRLGDVKPWWGKVRVGNAYGPSECTPTSVINTHGSSPEEVTSIGKGVGLVTWVVDPENHNCLLPPGCIGELLLEGPLVGSGYLNDPDKTAAAFIGDLTWLLRGAPGRPARHGRLYKTGDLVRYNADGSLMYVGRKDAQVKIRGQRVELGEVEYRVQEVVPEARHVVAEVIVPEGRNSSPTLAAFLEINDNSIENDKPEPNDTVSILPIAVDIEERLANRLPNYMIPTVLFSMKELPMTRTGKTDRRRLREIGASFSVQQLAEMRTAGQVAKRQPTSDTEKQMQRIWAQVLNIDPASIGLDDSFFRLGGDSIAAMKVVGETRQVAIDVSVADIFRHPSLEHIARRCILNGERPNDEFHQSILVDPIVKAALLTEIDSLDIAIRSSTVGDILPLTQFQEDYVVTGITYPRQFCNYFYLDLGVGVDILEFKRNCSLTLERFPVLRACFLPLLGRLWQVILRQLDLPLHIHDVNEDLSQALYNFCLKDINDMSPTRPPVAFILLRHRFQGVRLILRLSHAQYDGISLPKIFNSLLGNYEDATSSQPPDFSRFLTYSHHRRFKSIAYWKKLLQGSSITRTQPKLAPKEIHNSVPEAIRVETNISLPCLPGNITLATLLCSAWAVLLARITGESDIVYGRLVAGRNSALDGIEEIVGPCVNVVPVRVLLSSLHSPAELLSSVQEQFIALGEADSLGLRDISEHCSDWPTGSKLDSAIQHQNIDEHPEFQYGESAHKTYGFQNPHAIGTSLYMISRPQGGRLSIEITANTHIMTRETSNMLLDGLGRIVGNLTNCLDASLESCIDEIDLEF